MSEQKQQPKIQTIEELEKYWDDFSKVYSSDISGAVSSLYISMIHFLKIENSKNILETAVGPGYLVPHLIQRKQNDAKLTVTDLSPKILAICQKRLELFQETPFKNLYSFDITKLQPFQGKQVMEQLGTTIQKANSEDLVDFQDNTFDTYISSLCLQLTSDPIKMIKETYRVLQPGGKAAFSVWGRKDHSLMLSMVPTIFQEMGIQMQGAPRSNFHLNDKQKLIKMFEDSGFFVQLAWDQFTPVNMISKKEDVENMFQIGANRKILEQIPEDKKGQFMNECYKRMGDVIVNQKQSIGLEAIIILVQKPQLEQKL